MRRGYVVRVTEGHHAGEIGLVVAVHDTFLRKRRFDVALDGYDVMRCFWARELERYEVAGRDDA